MTREVTSYTVIVIKSGGYYIDTDPSCSVPPVFCTLGYAKGFTSKEEAEAYVDKYKKHLINPVEIQTLRFATEIVKYQM